MASQNAAKNQLESVTGSRATYYPFGDYRGIPPAQTLTDRGFTGQKSNNQPAADLGLLYYNARYYAPGIARFLSTDTIVPDPANPQAFNRYAYTLNNPVNFTDPSGHNPVWCNDPYDAGGGPECAPLVDFKVVAGAGVSWTSAERMTVILAAARIDFAFMRYGSSFLKVYGGTVTFTKTGTYAEQGNLGLRENQNSILVYEHDSATVVSEGPRWVAHELGHAFDSALHPNTTDDKNYGQGTIDLATSNINYTDVRGENVQLTGGCNIGNYLTGPATEGGCYIRESGYDMGYVDEFNKSPTPMEDFADMFSGYIFGFADNAAGQARYDWMNSRMSTWVSLAVTNNNR